MRLQLDYFGGTSGTYAGFDRFGRVIRQEWYDYGASETRDRHDYTYDANSNRTSRDNTLTTGKDEKYTYDGLDRLTGYDRGTLSGGDITNKVRNEAWTLSQTGNWGEFKIDADGDGSYDDAGDLDQNRAHNDVNEITGITEDFGPAWADPAYDAAGNMTTAPKPTDMTATYTCTYDAWNRLCEVSSGETTVGRYEYDGLNRRIKKHIDTQAPGSPDGVDTYRHFFYDSSWRVIETRSTTSDPDTQPETLQPEYQYVWSLRYIDAPILRDKNTDADDLCDDQRLYYLADANMNVTALADTGGDTLERYAYDPYGNVTVLDADWTDDADNVSDVNNDILYCGYRYDAETGLYHVRNRYLHPRFGWITRDPLGYVDGMNLYEYCTSMPAVSVDPFGQKLDLSTHWSTLVGGEGKWEEVTVTRYGYDVEEIDFRCDYAGAHTKFRVTIWRKTRTASQRQIPQYNSALETALSILQEAVNRAQVAAAKMKDYDDDVAASLEKISGLQKQVAGALDSYKKARSTADEYSKRSQASAEGSVLLSETAMGFSALSYIPAIAVVSNTAAEGLSYASIKAANESMEDASKAQEQNKQADEKVGEAASGMDSERAAREESAKVRELRAEYMGAMQALQELAKDIQQATSGMKSKRVIWEVKDKGWKEKPTSKKKEFWLDGVWLENAARRSEFPWARRISRMDAMNHAKTLGLILPENVEPVIHDDGDVIMEE